MKNERRRHPRRPAPNAGAALWPVHVWKVLHARESPQADVFELAILGLTRTGRRDLGRLAESLGLDQDLVASIVSDRLIPKGWLTPAHGLAAAGAAVLEGAPSPGSALRLGYAYQDAVSGAFLPRFTATPPEIALETSDAARPQSAKEGEAFHLRPMQEASPDGASLMAAYRRYERDRRFMDAPREAAAHLLPLYGEGQALEFVESPAEPMRLLTWIAPNPDDADPVRIADPFGLSPTAPWLHSALLTQALPKDPRLAAHLEKLCDKPLAFASPRAPDGAPHNEDARRRAKEPRSLPQRESAALLTQAHEFVDSALRWLLAAHPLDLRRLPNRKLHQEWMSGEAQEHLRALNLPALSEKVAARLASQRLEEVRRAAERRSASLEALVFAVALATAEHDEHPFLTASPERLNLEALLDLMEARRVEGLSLDKATTYREFAVNWASMFTGGIHNGHI